MGVIVNVAIFLITSFACTPRLAEDMDNAVDGKLRWERLEDYRCLDDKDIRSTKRQDLMTPYLLSKNPPRFQAFLCIVHHFSGSLFVLVTSDKLPRPRKAAHRAVSRHGQ